MEAASEGEKKKPPEGGETKSKRQMKTAVQLEILEKTYAVEAYPSEATRAELSVQLGLSDRQLQMWFCHRRLKDRKPLVKRQRKDSPSSGGVPADGEELAADDAGNEPGLGSGMGSTPFGHVVDPRRLVSRPGVALARIGSDMQTMKRYYESPLPRQLTAELRAIAFVERQLGEPLKEEGPILGMEFDPLPPGAFGAPIGAATVVHHKQSGQAFEAKLYERPDAKLVKGSVRTLHEYQFLPEQPTIRTDQYEKVTPSHHYGSPTGGPKDKASAIPAGHFMQGDEQVRCGYGFPIQIPNLNLLSQQGRQDHLLPSASGEYDNVPQKSITNTAVDANFGSHPITALENPFVLSERRINHDEDVSRTERKRKSEEARIAREVEANEKRIRKELEKQDILRRKREEQIRKEMERHDRERRKEEERLLRERQREEERYLREQRRELERREKFLQKESIRAEKMRQKEELRREKEAARLKAANERAIARRIAKESMELIEDERLELMELATASKGLPSILSLDLETLQILDLFRDKLSLFPPKTVQLKRPFAIKPWNGSEENTGNLLMVWRFLITFADVLGLWPFTLDEFVQAFHDYDPRLLGEIHVALLRSIIKDIEDVARTPSTGFAANQNSAANLGGGHPQIVEGAYAWGFDIRSWQRHLNALTWPEILRQFALSAGFGPQMKKRNIEQTYLRDENEGNDGLDVISTLRNGVAVENAVAIMQERGFSNPRRSRHRLTPGTVKFAAFHVLSLEGSRGLTILEVAEKIQKSGLRDLTTSKTPEASIAAALSRDTKLFERTAPSTYCVRPAYRKDPADAEEILFAARERIRIFKTGVIEVDDVDDPEKDEDDAEKDEDSESDVAEEPEVEDAGTELNTKKESCSSQQTENNSVKLPLENGKASSEFMGTPLGVLGNVNEGLSSVYSEDLTEVKCTVASADGCIDATGLCNGSPSYQEDADIDERNPGEPWVQGLMEGEYSGLSVEERLNALVALIGVAIEGNSIRVVLEDRLEAANALKKQMWAEVQLDKRRIKEEYVLKTYYPSYLGNKSEPNLTMTLAEGRQSPLVTADKSNEMSVDQQERLNDPHDLNYFSIVPCEGNLQMQDTVAGPDNFAVQQPGYATEKSRSQLKSYIGYRAEEMYVYRSLPLGQDRRRNRYWRFTTSASWNDPGCGRIFVELHDGHWRLIDSEEGFDALLASLDVRGVRESHLHSMLQKIEMSFKEAAKRKLLHATAPLQSGHTVKIEAIERTPGPDYNLNLDSPSSTVCGSDSDLTETSTSFTIELGRNEIEKNGALRRYQDFEKWMWKECFNSPMLFAMKYGKQRCKQLLDSCDYCQDIYYFEDSHCPSCHRISGTSKCDLNFSEHMAQCEEKLKMEIDSVMHGSISSPLRIRLLKLHLALVEVSIPSEALQAVWTHSYRKRWGLKLHSSTSAEELLQILTLLEGAIKRDYLSSNFETTSELLGSPNESGGAANDPSAPCLVPVLPWVPKTTAAVALRVLEFDHSITYVLNQKVESQKDKAAEDFIKLPLRFAVMKNTQDDETAETPYRTGYHQEANWGEVGIGFSSSGRGRGGRGRGRGRTRNGKSQRNASGSRSETGKRITTTNSGGLGPVLTWKGRSRGRGGRKRGRRSTRSRQKSAKKVAEVVGKREKPKEILIEKSSRGLGSDEWNGNEVTELQVEGAEDASSSGRSEYNDENGQASGDEYDYLMADDYPGGFNSVAGNAYNGDGDEDDDDGGGGGGNVGVDAAEEEQGNLDVEGYINDDSDEEGLGDGNDRNGDAISSPDEGMALSPSASEYSV